MNSPAAAPQVVTDLEKVFIAENSRFLSSEKSQNFSLANYRDFVVRSDGLSRLLLYKMRDEGKSIMTRAEKEKFLHEDKKPNHEFCGLNLKWQSETVDLVRTDKKRLAFRGLSMCGLVWRCPICSMKILQGRQNQLYEYIQAHQKLKREVGFVTLTIPHKKTDKLKDTLEKLNDNYRRFQNTRFFKKHKISMLGQVKALEITYTYQNGWHPHLHILFFYNDVSKVQIQSIHEDIVNRWVDFRDNAARLIGQDAKLCYDNDIVEYMAKWDVVREVTAVHIKKSKGFTPFQILKKLVLKDYTSSNKRFFLVERFREYIEYTKGRHRLAISPKLSKEYPEVKNKTDEELLNEVKVEEVLLRFQYIIWLQLSRKGLQPHLINAYNKSGIEGIYDLFAIAGIQHEVRIDRDNKPVII